MFHVIHACMSLFFVCTSVSSPFLIWKTIHRRWEIEKKDFILGPKLKKKENRSREPLFSSSLPHLACYFPHLSSLSKCYMEKFGSNQGKTSDSNYISFFGLDFYIANFII